MLDYFAFVSVEMNDIISLCYSYTGVEVPERGIFTLGVSITAIMCKYTLD